MTNEDFVKWLRVKSHKLGGSNGSWLACISILVEEFKKEWGVEESDVYSPKDAKEPS